MVVSQQSITVLSYFDVCLDLLNTLLITIMLLDMLWWKCTFMLIV